MAERARRKIGLAYVEVTDEARRNVQDCLDTGMLARGKYVEQFEEMIAAFARTTHAVAVCNGTMANVLMLRAMRDLYGWRQVTVPALTFAAQLSSVLDAGLEPRFCDVGLDLRTIVDEPDRPLFAVSLLGIPSTERGAVVLDSCETFAPAFGKEVHAATCSFYATHAVGIGEGGAIVTNDSDVASRCRSMRDHGQIECGDAVAKFRHPIRGYNAKMSNIVAAVGCGQIAVVREVNRRRMEVLGWYDKIMGTTWGDLMVSPHGYPVDLQRAPWRDAKLMELQENNVEARRVFSVLCQNEVGFLELENRQEYRNARIIANQWLYVPCHQGMSRDDVERVCEVLRR